MKAGLGVFVTHIPFRGSGNSVPAMIGGQVDMVFASPPSLTGFVKSGQAAGHQLGQALGAGAQRSGAGREDPRLRLRFQRLLQSAREQRDVELPRR